MPGTRPPSDSPSSFHSTMDLPRTTDHPPTIGPSSPDTYQQQHEPQQGGRSVSNASSSSRPPLALAVPSEPGHELPVAGPSFQGIPSTSLTSVRPGSEGIDNGERVSFPRPRPSTLRGGGGTALPSIEFGMDAYGRMPASPTRARTVDGHSQIYIPVVNHRQSARDLSQPSESTISQLARSQYEPPTGTSLKKRLEGTTQKAKEKLIENQRRAKLTWWLSNVAIGLQILLGALTTGLSVALSGKQVSVATAILGGFSTIVASYLARARGSGEPEASTARVKELEQFIRECEAFDTDFGGHTGRDYDERLTQYRIRLEEILSDSNPNMLMNTVQKKEEKKGKPDFFPIRDEKLSHKV